MRTPEELEEAAEAIQRDGDRRARGELRRWIRHTRCDRLITLTFAQAVTDYAQAAAAVDRFLRRWAAASLYKGRGGSRAPLAIVLEPHPGGHGWHAHAVTRGYVDHGLLKKLWSEGHVWISGPRRERGTWAPRKLAAYLAKYIGKEFSAGELHGCSPRPAGAHRWFHSQGDEPPVERRWFYSLRSALSHLRRAYGQWDTIFVFGLADDGPRLGVWLSFPDEAIGRWHERVKADRRA